MSTSLWACANLGTAHVLPAGRKARRIATMANAATSRAHAPSEVAPSVRPPGWARQALLVLYKDVAIEMRSGELAATSGFFALLVVVVCSMAFYGGPETRRLVAPGVIWLAIAFATVLALGRSWQREREERALAGLLVAPLARSAIFAGKALGLLLFLLLLELGVVPLTALLLAIDLTKVGLGIGLICLCATPGIAAAGTLFGAMTVRTRARDLVLAIVLLPLLAPTLLTAVAATRSLLDGATVMELADYFKLMGVFNLTLVAGGLSMFGPLIED